MGHLRTRVHRAASSSAAQHAPRPAARPHDLALQGFAAPEAKGRAASGEPLTAPQAWSRRRTRAVRQALTARQARQALTAHQPLGQAPRRRVAQGGKVLRQALIALRQALTALRQARSLRNVHRGMLPRWPLRPWR